MFLGCSSLKSVDFVTFTEVYPSVDVSTFIRQFKLFEVEETERQALLATQAQRSCANYRPEDNGSLESKLESIAQVVTKLESKVEAMETLFQHTIDQLNHPQVIEGARRGGDQVLPGGHLVRGAWIRTYSDYDKMSDGLYNLFDNVFAEDIYKCKFEKLPSELSVAIDKLLRK